MNPSLRHKSALHTPHLPPLLSSPLLSSCHLAMSQEGANLPQEVEGSLDLAAAPHGNVPAAAGVGSPTAATVMPTVSNSNSVGNQDASAGNSAGPTERANPMALSASDGEDNNAASSKIACLMLLHAGDEDNNAASAKIAAAPTVLLASEENKAASPAVRLAGEEKGSDAAPKLAASPAKLQESDNSKSGSQAAGEDNSAARSTLASSAVLHAASEAKNGGSKQIAGPAVPHATVDNTGQPMLTSVVLPLPAFVDKKARTKLAIQGGPHASGNNAGPSTRLTRSAAAALQAAKENASKLADVQVVPCLHAGKGNNAGSSSSKAAARRPAAESSRAAAAEDADHELHIFTERERRKKMKNMFSTLHALLPNLPDKADKATIVGEAVTFIQSLERTAERLEQMKLERQRAQAVGGAGSSSSRASSSARQPAPAPAAPAPREATLADMVHGWELQAAQQAAVAAANKALAAAAAGSSSSSSGATQQLPRGAVPFPAPPAGFQTWSGQNVVVSVGGNEAYINLRVPRQLSTLTKVLFVLERHHLNVVTATVSTEDGIRMYSIHARANLGPVSAAFPQNLSAEDRFKLAVSEIVQLINF